MGLFSRKDKYDKLSREEVVEAICALEQESQDAENAILAKQKQIDDLKEKGKKEKSRDIQLFYAKKINALKSDREQCAQRAMYLMYNIQLLTKLKQSIDDNKFFKNSSKTSINSLLADQKGLAKFLNKTLGNRIEAENILTSADETFKEIEEMYEKNDAIYGVNSADDALLAMFETEAQTEAESELFESEIFDSEKKEGV